MGMLDSILGGLMGGSTNSSPLTSILGSILGGGTQSTMGGAGGGLGGLLRQFTQAGHGETARSWVGTGANQPIDPDSLRHVFGQQQVDQWSQQTGMPQHDLLSQLSNLLPHAVDQMTPHGQVPSGVGASPFDEGGMELPKA